MHYSEGNYHNLIITSLNHLPPIYTQIITMRDVERAASRAHVYAWQIYSLTLRLETSDVGCATEVGAVCNGVTDADGTKWNIQGCIIEYLYCDSLDVYCSVAKCRLNGGSFASCWAQPFYDPPSVVCSKTSDEQTPSSNDNMITFQLLPQQSLGLSWIKTRNQTILKKIFTWPWFPASRCVLCWCW